MEDSPSTTLDLEVLFDLLAAPCRRQVIGVLEELGQHNRTTLRDLSVQLADEDDSFPDSLAIALHHHHLPKLDDAGLIEYDPSTKLVTPVALSSDQWADGLDITAGED